MIKIGPAGIGGIKIAESNLKQFSLHNLKAAEIAFTYGVYLKKPDTTIIGKLAKELDIDLSIHAPYYINLNSKDKLKIEQSKNRILSCCEIGSHLFAKYVVFHPGFYGDKSKEETFEIIKSNILDLQDKLKKNNWKIKLAPETTGKVNVFGSLDEILDLVKETKCHFCVDFAHLKARNLGKLDLDETLDKIKKFEHIHSHFSGINFGVNGEKNHIPIDIKETTNLLNELKQRKISCTIICEAPDTFGDAVKMQKILEKK